MAQIRAYKVQVKFPNRTYKKLNQSLSERFRMLSILLVLVYETIRLTAQVGTHCHTYFMSFTRQPNTIEKFQVSTGIRTREPKPVRSSALDPTVTRLGLYIIMLVISTNIQFVSSLMTINNGTSDGLLQNHADVPHFCNLFTTVTESQQ